jgi:hypothetical protein
MPPPIDDPVFGRLEWDGDDLVGEIEYRPSHLVALFFNLASNYSGTLAAFLTRARQAYHRFRSREGLYRRRSGAELNATRWNVEDNFTEEDVANLLIVATLEFQADGEMHVYWNDSDILYGGHNVITVIDRYGRYISAGMQ